MASGQNINGLTVDDIFYFQYRQLPEALKHEVLDFMGYLSENINWVSLTPLDVFKEYME